MLRPLINPASTAPLALSRQRPAIIVDGGRASRNLPHRLPALGSPEIPIIGRGTPGQTPPPSPTQRSSPKGLVRTLPPSPASTPDVRDARPQGTREVRPELVCVYCGHPLYAPPKAHHVRCPVCIREISVLDITLSGDVQRADEIVTAGKIIVAIGARVCADLVACSIEVGGKVLGDVLASQSCRIRCTAKVSGRVLCRHFILEPGAQLEGLIETIQQ
jgi:hypothetical protein